MAGSSVVRTQSPGVKDQGVLTFNPWFEDQVSRMIWSFRDAVVPEMWHEVSRISTVAVCVTTLL